MGRLLLGLTRLSRSRAVRLYTALALVFVGVLAAPPAQAADAVLVGAGDIADCTNAGDSATAALLGSIGGTVITLGDNAYQTGTGTEFTACYGPTWGKFKGRTRPAVGNHDYDINSAAGYFNYFRSAAGPWGKGWYSYDAGAWHVVVLNANCDKVGCARGSEQEKWLRADLAAHQNLCTVAYWHQARFVSDDTHGNDNAVGPFWDALYQYGADLVLSAHAHVYERFGPQTPAGKADSSRGIREIVVGTGGESHYGLKGTQPNSQVRNSNTFGVIKLTLHDKNYEWRFMPSWGKGFSDSGTGDCH
jgi:hypothetical protein